VRFKRVEAPAEKPPARLNDRLMVQAARVVDFVAADAQIGGGGWFGVVIRNAKIPSSVARRNLAPVLRGVVFIRQPHLGAGLDHQFDRGYRAAPFMCKLHHVAMFRIWQQCNGSCTVAKISMLEASKLFDVSRPTLLKHIQQGKITGEKVQVDKNIFWSLEIAELSRVYQRRVDRGAAAPEAAPEVTNPYSGATAELQAENRELRARLEGVERLLEERQKRLDDLQRQLAAPKAEAEAKPTRRGWWPFGE
jgi:hypothetical protein